MNQSLTAVIPRTRSAAAHEHLDARRRLQLALAGLWLLDALLQFQPVMFGRGFGQMLAASAPGNPAIVARPVTWSAAFIGHHAVVLNAIFAAIQLLLGLGIAARPAVRFALAASVAWSLAVWWLGEGLGGLLAGQASPVNGAPGAVILYALLAVLLWPADRHPADRHPADRHPADRHPADRDPATPFPAARAVGRRAARACWLTLWLGLAALALLPAARTTLSTTIAATTPGEPAWLAWLDAHAATALARHALLASVLLATLLTAVALVPLIRSRHGRSARVAVILALAVAAALWLAQALGGLLTGSATDPGTAPLLALFALAFWPTAPARPAVSAQPATPGAA